MAQALRFIGSTPTDQPEAQGFWLTLYRHRWVLLVVFLVAMGLRTVVVYRLGELEGPRPGSDAHEYDRNGWNLATGNGLRGPSPSNGGRDLPSAFRPPGQAFLLAACYSVFGHRYDAALLVNGLLGAVTAVLIGTVGSRAFGKTAGWVAAGAYALSPAAAYGASSVLAEPLFTLSFFLPVAAATFLGNSRKRSLYWFLMGALLGWATLVRPEALFALPFVLLWLASSERGSLPTKAWLGVRLLGAFGLVLAPWAVRNALVFERFIPFSTGGGTAFLGANNRVVVEDERQRGYWVYDGAISEYRERFAGLGEYERSQASFRAGLDYLRENPGAVPRMMAWKMSRFWSPFIKAENRMMRVVMLASWGPVLVLFLGGVVLFLREPGGPADSRRFMLLLLLYHVPLVLIFYGSPRLRSAIEPICVLFAGHFVARSAAWWQARRSPARAPAA